MPEKKLQPRISTTEKNKIEDTNIIVQTKEFLFKALYINENNSNFKCSDGEEITKFITQAKYKMNGKTYIRVEGENNNLFYIFSTDKYHIIHKFYIEENGKKELVKSMYGNTIKYMGKQYTRIITKESGTFYIDIKNLSKLYYDNKLVNFLKEKRNGEFQIETY